MVTGRVCYLHQRSGLNPSCRRSEAAVLLTVALYSLGIEPTILEANARDLVKKPSDRLLYKCPEFDGLLITLLVNSNSKTVLLCFDSQALVEFGPHGVENARRQLLQYLHYIFNVLF